MERIGIAASKVAKGNLLIYNSFVILLATLLSLLIFFIAGCAIVITLVLFAYLTSGGNPPDLEDGWMSIMLVCMICLAVIIFLLDICAIFKNIKFKRN